MGDAPVTITLELPRRLLTVADWEALPEDPDQHWELLEGVPVVVPTPSFRHNRAGARLVHQLETAVGNDYAVAPDSDVDLRLAPDTAPGTVRAPDVLVIGAGAYERLRAEGGIVRAEELVLAVEIMSPGSRRTDRIMKLADYADAGIPHYWIVDLDAGPSLLANRLVSGRYEQAGPETGVFTTDAPFPVSIDLAALT